MASWSSKRKTRGKTPSMETCLRWTRTTCVPSERALWRIASLIPLSVQPLLRPVQDAIYKVLEGNNQKISLELRGKVPRAAALPLLAPRLTVPRHYSPGALLQSEELKRAKSAREETGVDLYTVQQQLAKLQMALERSHEQFNIMSQMRERSEEDNGKMSDLYQVGQISLDCCNASYFIEYRFSGTKVGGPGNACQTLQVSSRVGQSQPHTATGGAVQ